MFFSSEDRTMERVNMKSINKHEIQTASINSTTSLLYLSTTPINIQDTLALDNIKLLLSCA